MSFLTLKYLIKEHVYGSWSFCSLYSFIPSCCFIWFLRVLVITTCIIGSSVYLTLSLPKLWNQVPSLDHFVVQNSGDFLCWKYKEVVCFYVSNLRPRHDLRCAIASCELRCAVASCDVRVQTHFVESCDVRACGAFLDLRCAIATSDVFQQ